VFLDILILLLLFIANGLFAMSEISVVSSRKIRLQQLADEGNTQAKAALKLAENPNQFLATVQIGITLVGIFAGAYGSATFAAPLASQLSKLSWLAPYSRPISVFLVVLLITYLSLVIGELVPKRIGLNNPERTAMMVAGFMNVLSKITTPFVKLLGASTELVLRLLGIRKPDEPPVSDQEITGLMAQGTEAGVFEEAEQEIVENILWLSDRTVVTLMRPRRDIIWLDLAATQEEIRHVLADHKHSRFVIGNGNLDKVLGFVDVRRLLPAFLSGKPLSLKDFLEQPLYFPETTPALTVLERFKETSIHFGLVVDEYGSVEGLVTLSDVLEDLVAISNEAPQVLQRNDGSWLLDGLLSIDDFKDHIKLDELPSEEDNDFRTLAGFIITYLGHIPNIGESLEALGYRFEIIDMDGNRIDKILLSQLPPQEIPTSDFAE
jgi:putative hemolysin